ncbi:MAG TPA: arylesterase [Azospira sp.]|nr:arylesterase [Azospira sp.]
MLSVLSALRLLLLAFALLAPVTQAAGAPTILVLGDSLSAGFGIRQDAAWPALLQQRIADKRLDYSVINASISGETSSGGRSRIADALARHRPTILILALGANDGLRGLPLAGLRENLAGIAAAAKQSKTRVLLVGMRLPPNYGAYADQFAQVFRDVAKETQAPLVPFLLDGVAERPELFLPDMLHPTAAAQPRLLDNVWRGLEPLLRRAR